MSNNLANNLMFTVSPEHAMKIMSDEQILEHLQIAHNNGWDINYKYGNDSNFYNALDALCMTGKIFYKSTQWLLENGIDKNLRSGNDNTAFTFFISNISNDTSNEEVIKYCEFLKQYGIDLSAPGYEDKTPLELYARYCYNKDVQQPIVDYLIKNADFENSFLLRDLFNDNKLFTFTNLKTIITYHNIDLKKVIIDQYDNEETYLHGIARGLNGRYWKESYGKINLLHDKLGFDLDRVYTYKDFDGTDDNEYHINVLGMAIQHENSNMFRWIMKKRPEQVNATFYINNKPYTFLEFCLLHDFRKGAKMALKSMNKQQLLSLNVSYLKQLCESNTIPRTLETLEKTYTHLLYKYMKSKYEQMPQVDNKDKKMKI